MPAEIDIYALMTHLDAKFSEADDRRREGHRLLHEKIDAQGIQLAHINTTLAGHISKTAEEFERRDKDADKKSSRAHDWAKTGVGTIFGSGLLWSAYHWLKGDLPK